MLQKHDQSNNHGGKSEFSWTVFVQVQLEFGGLLWDFREALGLLPLPHFPAAQPGSSAWQLSLAKSPALGSPSPDDNFQSEGGGQTELT